MIDLHTHTFFSDGSLSVEELLRDARTHNIDILSITDHDTTDSIRHTSKIEIPKGMIIIPGIELSTDTYYLNKKTKIHLLGYGYDYDHPNLNKMIDDKYLLRKEDNKEYIEELISKFSFLSSEMFEDFQFGEYGWIRKLILKHLSKYISEEDKIILKEYLRNNMPNYRRYNFDIIESINMIHEAGGYTVFAHPYQTELEEKELNNLVKYLKENRLDGIETYHAESSIRDREISHRLSLEYDLYETGGSDFHHYVDQTMVGYGVDERVQDSELVKKLIKEGKIL